jgi:nucleotide-binding universal stress UspA family protein
MRIICATDFSPAADRAALIAARLASAFGDHLVLLHVLPRSPLLNPETVADTLAPLRQAAHERLAIQKERVGAAPGEVNTEVDLGDPHECLVEHSAAPDCRLLVLGTHGRPLPARLILGSVAEKVVRHAHCAVLVVPLGDAAAATGWGVDDLLRITAEVDLSSPSDGALLFLRSLAKVISSQIDLVPGLRLQSQPGSNEELLRHYLRHRINRIWPGGAVRLTRKPLGAMAPPVEEALEGGAELLVIGMDARRRSNAIETLRASKSPVLCVPGLRSATVGAQDAPATGG